jgi:hypothetical protein
MSDNTNQIAAALEAVAPVQQAQTLESQVASLKLAVTLLNAGFLQAIAAVHDRLAALEAKAAVPNVVYVPLPPAPITPAPAPSVMPNPVQPTVTISKTPDADVTRTVQCALPLQSLAR